jgi:penicillin-binding protein 1A
VDSKAEQFYPTYTFKAEHRDVVLLEFEEAQKIANGQTKVYGQVTNVLLAVITIMIPLFFNQDNQVNQTFSFVKENDLVFSIIIFLFGALLLRYFVDLQKQITINGKKVVTLRIMLGLDYGHIHLTLPNWRVEGATNPFAIKYFNGWFNFQSMPFWVLIIGVNAVWWLTMSEKSNISFQINNLFIINIWLLGHFVITLSYLYIFRTNLNDTHETNFLNFGKILASMIRFKLVNNFESIIYRAKLAVVEMSRLNVNFDTLKPILINIEDKGYYSHKGVSPKAFLRGVISQIKILKKKYNLIESGGSTITMQLARTLFIPSNQNKYVRKFFEIWISLWLHKQFSKDDILNLYIVSVRYDYGIMGISKAINYFFGEVSDKKLSPEESFILVERLSNVTGTYKKERVNFLIDKSISNLDKNKIHYIYEKLIQEGKIKK